MHYQGADEFHAIPHVTWLAKLAWEAAGHPAMKRHKALRCMIACSYRLTIRTRPTLNGAKTVAFSPGSQLVVSASDDNTVRMWEFKMGRATACLRAIPQRLRFPARWSASDANTVRMWEAAMLESYTDWVNVVTLSPDGQSS